MMSIERYASHLPVLSFVAMRLHDKIDSVLEVGCGYYSTPLLSVLAAGKGLRRTILESDREWAAQISDLFGVAVTQFNAEELPASVVRQWGLVFIDSAIEAARARHAIRLREYAKVIILHDSNPDWDAHYRYSEIVGEWKHAKQFTKCYPHSLLLTNDDDAWGLLG